MKKLAPIAAALTALLASGCAHTLTEQEKADFTAYADQQAFKEPKKLGPTKATRVPLQAGQWATIETELRDDQGKLKDLSLATYKILNVTPDAVTLELETRSATHPKGTIMAYVVSHYPAQSTRLGMTKEELDRYVDQLEFRRIIIQNGDGRPNEIPTNLQLMAKPYVKNLLVNGFRVGEVKKEPCSSQVISSPKCLGYDYQTDLLGRTIHGHVDAHSAIPIVGFVSQQSDFGTSRVIAFGLSGARARLIH
jgi:hypothetical protein